MAELLGQLNRIPERMRSSSAPNQGTVFNPPAALRSESADEGGSNPSILIAAGIILGCLLCGALLLLLAAGSKGSSTTATPYNRTSPQQTSNSTVNSNESMAPRDQVGSNQVASAKGRAAKSRGTGSRRLDRSKFGGAYVVAEPGKTPRMFESQ